MSWFCGIGVLLLLIILLNWINTYNIENFDTIVTNMRSFYNRNKRNVRSSLQNSTDGFLSNTRNLMRKGGLLY